MDAKAIAEKAGREADRNARRASAAAGHVIASMGHGQEHQCAVSRGVDPRRDRATQNAMRILTFQAQRFAWRPHERTLDGSESGGAPAEMRSVDHAVVAFVHAQTSDESPEARERTLRHATKHIQWLANKRSLANVVLHSFTHLAADTASAAFAEAWLADLAAKLSKKGYTVSSTPFGYSCAWELSVFGESLAKVWKEI
jgi:nucleotide-binding universal stress UspA family protein